MSHRRGNADRTLDWETARAELDALPPASRREYLHRRWSDLCSPPPASALRGDSAAWKQRRGYALERLILLLAHIEGLDPHPPHRAPGEQIDGFFVVGHRGFLLEARWQDRRAAAADVYAFQGKLRGKLVGTLGLFVSIGGFADDISDALRFGKELDVLLADRDDIDTALADGCGLAEMVKVKVRAAERVGAVYYGYKRWLDQLETRRP